MAGHKIAPDGIEAWNPAFDVTPASLITAIVTDKGVVRPKQQTGNKEFDIKAFCDSTAEVTLYTLSMQDGHDMPAQLFCGLESRGDVLQWHELNGRFGVALCGLESRGDVLQWYELNGRLRLQRAVFGQFEVWPPARDDTFCLSERVVLSIRALSQESPFYLWVRTACLLCRRQRVC